MALAGEADDRSEVDAGEDLACDAALRSECGSEPGAQVITSAIHASRRIHLTKAEVDHAVALAPEARAIEACAQIQIESRSPGRTDSQARERNVETGVDAGNR